MSAPSSQPDARTHRMENASVYCRYCGAHPDNWQREQCEHREPDARTAREHAETAVQEAKKLTDLLRRGGPGWFLFAKKIPDVCDAALDALLALVERLEQERERRVEALRQIKPLVTGDLPPQTPFPMTMRCVGIADIIDAALARFAALQPENTDEAASEDPTAGLPADLVSALRDPNVVVPQDAALFDLLAKWKNAPSDTASAETPEGEGR